MARSSEVDAWFRGYDNPMKPVMLRVRNIVLAADRRIDECIKWQTPTFTFEGNLASFNPRAKKFVSLLFHTGASIPGRFPRLQGGGATARYMNITDLADVEVVKKQLEEIVRAWCASRSESAPPEKAARQLPKVRKSRRKARSN